MPRPASRLALATFVALAACSSDATSPTPDVRRLDIVPAAGPIAGLGGKALNIAPGDSARLSAVISVGDGGSTPAAGLTWASTNAAIADVDATGLLRARGAGTATVTARTTQYADTLTVTVSSCGAGTLVTLDVGGVQTLPAGQGAALCVTSASSASGASGASGGASPAGAEYALVAFNADLDSARATNDVRTAVNVTATGIGATPLTNLADGATDAAATIPGAALALSRAPTIDDLAASLEPVRPRDAAFDAALRRTAARELQPRMAALRSSGVSLDRGPNASVTTAVADLPTVGQLLRLNTSLEPCDTTKANGLARRAGRVVAVSARAIIVADTLNPAGGFTADEYAAFAAAFDTLAYPVDVANFGEPRDIDSNGGRAVIFFTSAVNAMTPRGASYYVSGFFYERDLFPNNKAAKDGGCGGSNLAEMFYMLVPDATGTINGNRFSKSFVSGVTVATLGHEFQHLINASRRLLVNDAPEWENVWLNEGLSHIAEELLFYRAAGIAPRAPRLDGASVVATPAVRAAFTTYLAPSNVSRFTAFLPKVETVSPYAANDDIETRAATWTFLRYAADRVNAGTGASDASLWQKLVATTKLNGMANLYAAFGVSAATMPGWFRDWAVANYADGLATGALDPRFSYRSWNFRSVVGGLRSPSGSASYPAYPLVSHPLTDGVTEQASLRPGAGGYFRFSVGAGRTARIATSGAAGALPSSVLVSVVRVR